MPPTAAAIRKASLISNTTPGNDASAGPSNARRITSSGRAIRTNTTRPTNYYARPFGNAAAQDALADQDDATPAGFFPALTFFSDAITALPKEVMRQFTLMKEVEAKIHGPTEQLCDVVDGLMALPVARRRDGQFGAGGGGLMSFTANNSATASANASLVNGVAPYGVRSGQNSTAGSTLGEEPMQQQETEEDLARRRQYHELRALMHNLLPNLEEKNVVLAEANRVLNLQLLPIDGVMPHVEAEIPEEARMGSMSHWAYSDNRQKTKSATQTANERNRRDVAATNSLAAAANAVHETEIAQARRDAGKEAAREKTGRGKNKEQIDSEFEERPRKTNAKVAKAKAATTVTGLGINTGGEPVKRRKVDKIGGTPAMERQLSSTGRAAAKATRETPRSTPAASEQPKKTGKAAKATPAPAPIALPPPPPPKRKGPASAQASPALANSPLMASSSIAGVEPPSSTRPQSARLRQNSSTNLRYERLADEEARRPASSAGVSGTKANGNGVKTNSRKRTREEVEAEPEIPAPAPQQEPEQEPEHEQQREQEKEQAQEKEPEQERHDQQPAARVSPEPATLKREDMADANGVRPRPSRSNSSSNKNPGRGSKMGTPRSENFPPVASQEAPTSMVRVRSTRSVRGPADTSSSEPPLPPAIRGHKRGGTTERGSMTGLMKQIAPFNKSPDMDRYRRGDDMDDDLESGGEGEDTRFTIEGTGQSSRRRTRSRPTSGTASRPVSRMQKSEGKSPAIPRRDDGDEDEEMADDVDEHQQLDREQSKPPNDTNPLPSEVARGSPAASPPARTTTEKPEHSPPASSIPSSPSPPAPDVDEPPSRSPSHPTQPAPTNEVQPEEEEAASNPPSEHEPSLEPDAGIPAAPSDEEEEEEEPDPDDPNGEKYCYCNRGSYGDMVGCENPNCPKEWFHLGCTDLDDLPGEEELWFCQICRPRGGRGRGGGRGGRGRGRGRGV